MFRNQRTYARILGVTQSISATTSSARTAAGVGTQVRLVRVHNSTASASEAFVVSGNSSVAATVGTGVPIGPGQAYHFAVDPGEYVAAICASGTATLYVSELDS